MDGLHVIGFHPFGEFHRAGLQIGQAHRVVRNGQIGHARDMDIPCIPVFGEAFSNNAFLRHTLHKTKRPGANGARAEIAPQRLGCLGADWHARTIRKRCQEGSGWPLQANADGQRVHHFHRFHIGDFAAAETTLQIQVTQQGILHSLCIHHFIVVKAHTFS